MINAYVGGVIYDVMAQHAANPTEATTLVSDYLPRWKEGGLTGAVVQVSSWEAINYYFTEFKNDTAHEMTFCRTRADFDNRPEGSFGIFFSLEGHGPLAGDFEALHTLEHIGVCTFTFSHNLQNPLCTGSNEPYDGGFTYLGKRQLKALEKVDLMIDLVHMSRASFWDALRYYDGDLYVSHSNCDALCQHPRNLTDEQIKAVAERNGVVGLNTFKGYVNNKPMESTLGDLLDHAMHMYDLVGPEHIAIGADYCESPVEMLIPVLDMVDPEGAHGIKGRGRDLYEYGPEGIEDPSKLSKLAVGLAERGLTQNEIDLICGESFLRMLERARPST